MSTTARARITPTVHIVDDDDSFRTAIARLLKAAGYCVQTYSCGTEFMRAHVDNGPGCVLVDMYMPDLSGLDVQNAVLKRGQDLPIIFISGQATIPATVRAMQAGAVDFLTKPIQKDALLSAVAMALARDAEARSAHEELYDTRQSYQTLTPRQQTVFEGVVLGKLNKQMAAEMGVAERTIKAHRAQVMKKMRVDSVAALVHIAIQLQDKPAPPSSRL